MKNSAITNELLHIGQKSTLLEKCSSLHMPLLSHSIWKRFQEMLISSFETSLNVTFMKDFHSLCIHTIKSMEYSAGDL